jgi:hypothetical protein
MVESRNLPKEWWDSWRSDEPQVEERPKGHSQITNAVRDFIELPDDERTIKDFYTYLGDLNQYKGIGMGSTRENLLAEMDTQFKDRRKNDGPSNKGRNMRDVGGDKYGLEDKAALARAALSNAEKAQAIKDAEAAEREAFLDSPKGRMQTMFNDADKRDAILGGISDAMLETRVGADAYGNRFARASKNVRNNLKVAEATDIARQQATLDAMKTMAETNKLVDPRQYMTDAQTEARSIVNARIRSGALQPGDFDTAYAAMLKQITVKDLTSAKASSISTMFTYAQALQGSDPVTAGILMDAIKSNALYLAGGADGGAQTGEVTIDATEYSTGN